MTILENYLKLLNNKDDLLNEAFFQSFFGKLKYSAKFTAVLTGLNLAWRSAKAILSDAERKCGAYSKTPAKQGCITREKIRGYNEQLKVIMKSKSMCNNTTDPKKCNEKIDKKINMILLRKRMNEIKLKEYENKLNEGFLGLFAAGIIVDSVFKTGWKTASALFSSAAKQCQKYKGIEYDICRTKLRLSALEKKQQILRRAMSYCNQENDPKTCKEKINSENEKLKARIQLEKETLILYQKSK